MGLEIAVRCPTINRKPSAPFEFAAHTRELELIAMQATELTCMQRGTASGKDRLPSALPCRSLCAPRRDRPNASPRRALHQPQNSRRLLRAADGDLQGAQS